MSAEIIQFPEPDTENVAYIDEYPHLAERIRLRNLGRPAVAVSGLQNLLIFERTNDANNPKMPE